MSKHWKTMKDYQARLDSIIDDFGKPKGAGEAFDPEPYLGHVPEALIDFWTQNCIGLILDGYFQFCDPDRYKSIVKFVFEGDPDIDPETTHVIGFGPFGTMIAWNERYQTVSIDLVKCQVSCSALTSGKEYNPNIALTSKLMLLDGAVFDEYDSDAKRLFKSAQSKLGSLRFGQIYGFKPILAFGGNRSLANLATYTALSHMAILAQAHQFQLMDNSPFPLKPMRVVGE
jgi:hypothetical protein